MDRTDVLLIQKLLVNSRTPYRELAEQLDISVNAVHKRVQGLIDGGVIKRFTAKVSFAALEGIPVLIYGIGSARPDEVMSSLGSDERVYWVTHASGGMMYVGGYLRSLGDLEDFTAMVRRKAGMASPQVGLQFAPPPHQGKGLSRLDYRIVAALEDDSRRSISELADRLLTSAKTVRKHLSRLIDENLAQLSLDWTPDKSNDIICIYHLQLRPEVDRFSHSMGLVQRYPQKVLFFFLFSNQPDTVLLTAWCSTIEEVNDLRRAMEGEEEIVSIVPNILIAGEVFDTWREETVRRVAAGKGQ